MDDYTDDPTILNDADLWRRIPPYHFVSDPTAGGIRISSAAFEDHPNGTPMSVFLADVVAEIERGPQDALAGHESFGLAAFTAGLARSCEQGVAREPLADEPAHAVVFGRKTKSVSRKLAKGSRWVVPPANR